PLDRTWPGLRRYFTPLILALLRDLLQRDVDAALAAAALHRDLDGVADLVLVERLEQIVLRGHRRAVERDDHVADRLAAVRVLLDALEAGLVGAAAGLHRHDDDAADAHLLGDLVVDDRDAEAGARQLAVGLDDLRDDRVDRVDRDREPDA